MGVWVRSSLPLPPTPSKTERCKLFLYNNMYSLCFEIPATFTKCGMRCYDDVCHYHQSQHVITWLVSSWLVVMTYIIITSHPALGKWLTYFKTEGVQNDCDLIYEVKYLYLLYHTPSVLKYLQHLPSAGCDVMMMYVISTNQELISHVITCCDWC